MDMTTKDKILEAFLTFPHRIHYLEELVEDIRCDFTTAMQSTWKTLYLNFEDGDPHISLSVVGVGVFSKEFLSDHEDGEVEYKCAYTAPATYMEVLLEPEATWIIRYPYKRQANEICSVVVPFVASCGTDITEVPLLMHEFPEFARFALQFEDKNNYDDVPF